MNEYLITYRVNLANGNKRYFTVLAKGNSSLDAIFHYFGGTPLYMVKKFDILTIEECFEPADYSSNTMADTYGI